MSQCLGHTSPDYQCPKLSPCPYTGQELLTRHRLGGEEEHRLWDKREDIRGVVRKIVKTVVGEDLAGDRDFINMARDREFINRLLANKEVFDTVQTIVGEISVNKSGQTVTGDNERSEGNINHQSESGYYQQQGEQNKQMEPENICYI